MNFHRENLIVFLSFDQNNPWSCAPESEVPVEIVNNYMRTNPTDKKTKREELLLLFHNLTVCKPVFRREQELRSHVQAILRADIIALGAEDALGDIDADTLC